MGAGRSSWPRLLAGAAAAAVAVGADSQASSASSSSSPPSPSAVARACGHRGDAFHCAQAHSERGLASYRKGELREAKEGLARASRLLGDAQPALLYNLALAHAADAELEQAVDLLRAALALPSAAVAFEDGAAASRDSREEILLKLLEFCARGGRLRLAEEQLRTQPLADRARQAWLETVLARQVGRELDVAALHRRAQGVDLFDRMHTWEHVLCCGDDAEGRLDHKDALATALRDAARAWPALNERGGALRPLHPETFALPDDYDALAAALASGPPQGGFWMLKPARMADGHGVRRVDGAELRGLVAGGSLVAARRLGRGAIAQRCVEDPLLWEGKKFDLRLYVLVASAKPLRLFLYRDGYVRQAPLKYTAAPSGDRQRERRVHITNRSQHNKKTGRCARTLADLREGLFGSADAEGRWARLWHRIEELLARAFVAALGRGPRPEGLCGKVYGVDVMVDAEHWPHLLEVNRAPAVDSGAGCPEIRGVHEPLARAVLDELLPAHGQEHYYY